MDKYNVLEAITLTWDYYEKQLKNKNYIKVNLEGNNILILNKINLIYFDEAAFNQETNELIMLRKNQEMITININEIYSIASGIMDYNLDYFYELETNFHAPEGEYFKDSNSSVCPKNMDELRFKEKKFFKSLDNCFNPNLETSEVIVKDLKRETIFINSIFFYGFDRLIYNKILHTVTFYKDFESKVKFHLLDIINMGYANSDYKLPLSDNSLQTFLI